MASSSVFMDDYSSENYSSSDDESFEFADDYLLVPATAEEDQPIDDHENQPIDDHENQPDEGAEIPEPETSTDFTTRGRDEPLHMGRGSCSFADFAELYVEGDEEAVEDSDAENAVDEREMSGVKEVVANDVEVDSEHVEADKATVGKAALETEVLMELAEAAIVKSYADVLATMVGEDEAVIDEPSHEIVVPEPTVEESEAKIDEPSDDIVVPELGGEEHHGIEEGSVVPELAVEGRELTIEEPSEDGVSAPELLDEVGAPLYDPAYQSDSSEEDFYSTDGIEEDGIGGVEEREATIDEPSYEMDAPDPAVVEGDEPSDEIDGSTDDAVLLERFGRVIPIQDLSTDDDEFSSDSSIVLSSSDDDDEDDDVVSADGSEDDEGDEYSTDDDEIDGSIDLVAELEGYVDGIEEELSPDGELPSDEIDGFVEDYYNEEMASLEDEVEEEYHPSYDVLTDEMISFMQNCISEQRHHTFANEFFGDYVYPSEGHIMGPRHSGDYLYPYESSPYGDYLYPYGSNPYGDYLYPYGSNPYGDYLYPYDCHMMGLEHSRDYLYRYEDHMMGPGHSRDYLYPYEYEHRIG